MTIPTHRYEYLCEIEKKYFEVQQLVGVEEGEGVQAHEKKKATLVGLKVGKKKVTLCNKCNVDYLSTHGLKRHINAFHLGQLNYICQLCNKELLTKEGIRMHMATHGNKDFICT